MTLLLALAPGCATTPKPAAVPARQGESSYRVLTQAEVSAAPPGPSADTITAIFPLAENSPPTYPEPALKAGCGDGLVPVRVHVGTDGHVSDVVRIPGRTVEEDACHRTFEAAVRQAVLTWKFIPAYRVRAVPAQEPGREASVERTPLALDVDYEFVFTVVAGRGTVRSK
jgi:outer membrane biosynthesis protein TonB